VLQLTAVTHIHTQTPGSEMTKQLAKCQTNGDVYDVGLHCTGCHGLGSNAKSGKNGFLMAEPAPRAQAIGTQNVDCSGVLHNGAE